MDYYETFFREYDAQIGRFTGVDAISEKTITQSPYQFAINNPISFNDPTGLQIDYKNTRGEFTNWNPQLKFEPGWLTSFWDNYWSDPFAATRAMVQAQNNYAFWGNVLSLPDHGYSYINNTYINGIYTTTRYWYFDGIKGVFNTSEYHGSVTFTEGEYYTYLGKTEPAEKQSTQTVNNRNENEEGFNAWETFATINKLTCLSKDGTENGETDNDILERGVQTTQLGVDVNATTWTAMSKIAGAGKTLGKLAEHGTIAGITISVVDAGSHVLKGDATANDYITLGVATLTGVAMATGVGEVFIGVVGIGWDIYSLFQ